MARISERIARHRALAGSWERLALVDIAALDSNAAGVEGRLGSGRIPVGVPGKDRGHGFVPPLGALHLVPWGETPSGQRQVSAGDFLALRINTERPIMYRVLRAFG